MKIYVYSRSKIYGGDATKNINNEIKVIVCKLPNIYSLENFPLFSSFIYDKTETVYRLSNHNDSWCILFNIFTPKDDPDLRYHEELYKLLRETLKLPKGLSFPEYRYYFTKNVCTTNQAEQFNDYKASSYSGFTTIHNILLPKVIEYYS